MAETFKSLMSNRLWVLVGTFFLWMCGSAVMIPHINPISVNYFAWEHAGDRSLDCGAYEAGQLPDACRAGTTASTAWVAGSSFVANAILGLLLVPLSGHFSDTFGRKPFLLAGVSPLWQPCCPLAVAACVHSVGKGMQRALCTVS